MTTIGRRSAPAPAPAPRSEPAAESAAPATPVREFDQTYGRLRRSEDRYGVSGSELAGQPNARRDALPTHSLTRDSFEAGRAVGRVGERGDDVQASVLEARVGGEYSATLGANGLRASASGAVEATVAQGSARVGIGSDSAGVQIGGQAYAGARMEGSAGLTIDPASGAYNANIRQEVFVGARAGINGRAALGSLGSAEGRVDLQVGIGASLEARGVTRTAAFASAPRSVSRSASGPVSVAAQRSTFNPSSTQVAPWRVARRGRARPWPPAPGQCATALRRSATATACLACTR